MNAPRQLVLWGAAAVVSLAALGVVVHRQRHEIPERLAVQVAATPTSGAAVFRNKGCASCHGDSAAGTEFGPSLRQSAALKGLPQLVTAMWNHAPHMWAEMRAQHLVYPSLSYQETSQLVTYLYMCAYADDSGDAKRGEQLFRARKCDQCHSRVAEAPGLVDISSPEDPLSWTQALWNHASGMQARMRDQQIEWPRFEASDLRDLFAYVRSLRQLDQNAQPDVGGDPARGWTLFQKSCIRCHSISSEPGLLGPSFGADHPLPPTFSEFGAALLNHLPKMQVAMEGNKEQTPQFGNHDVADITVFLYSLHYLEPTGSPLVGKSVLAWRGCSRCHGSDGEGTSSGPSLRGRGQIYTAVRLATALWGHGARMYDSMQKHDEHWPALHDSDVGPLLTFLNTSP